MKTEISYFDFVKIFDYSMLCEIEIDKSKKGNYKYRPYIAIRADGLLLNDLNIYFKNNLPNVLVNYNSQSRRLFIRAFVNVLPVLNHILDKLYYKKDIASVLHSWCIYRITKLETGNRFYDEHDLLMYEKMKTLSGRHKWL
jgi:hypothetical protein